MSDLAALMQPVAPAKLQSSGLLLPPNKPFFKRHHPANWFVATELDEPLLLPEVTLFALVPGVNGVRTLSKDEVSRPQRAYEQAVWREEQAGWVFLSPADPVPVECLPPGVSAGGYLRALDCTHPITGNQGKHYTEAWNVPVATPVGVTQQWRFDQAAYERWLLFLVKSGDIAPPSEFVVQRILGRAAKHVEYAQSAQYTDPELKRARLESRKARLEAARTAAENKHDSPDKVAQLAAKDAQIAALERQLAALKPDDKPKPKRTPRRKAAAGGSDE